MMNAIIVFIGGGLGALIRYLLSLILPKIWYFPASTLVANFFGCFVATVVFVYFIDKLDSNSSYKIFWIIGFCGGLSTLSALSLEVLEFLEMGEFIKAFIYMTTTVFVCTVSVLLGLLLVKHSLSIKL
ncbi:CrcB family protein [bacterium]|nr:CrcB family protein [bacterium]